MNRRDFNIGAILALLCTGASMTPENERKAIVALERIAKALEELARNDGRRSNKIFTPTRLDVSQDDVELWAAYDGREMPKEGR